MLLMINIAASQEIGKTEVIKDPRIDSLIARRIELNKSQGNNTSITPTKKPKTIRSTSGYYRESAIPVKGYRIQIFSGSNRQEAYSEQARFMSSYPAIRTYISYLQPNYKIRVGDFRTRMEAEKMMKQLKPRFKTLFIITERVKPR